MTKITDCKWFVKVTGITGVSTYTELLSWFKSKQINPSSEITFVGTAYPSTVLGFKHLMFKSVVQLPGHQVTIVISTADAEELSDLNEVSMAFNVALNSIAEVGQGYTISAITAGTYKPSANCVSVVSCL